MNDSGIIGVITAGDIAGADGETYDSPIVNMGIEVVLDAKLSNARLLCIVLTDGYSAVAVAVVIIVDEYAGVDVFGVAPLAGEGCTVIADVDDISDTSSSSDGRPNEFFGAAACAIGTSLPLFRCI